MVPRNRGRVFVPTILTDGNAELTNRPVLLYTFVLSLSSFRIQTIRLNIARTIGCRLVSSAVAHINQAQQATCRVRNPPFIH